MDVSRTRLQRRLPPQRASARLAGYAALPKGARWRVEPGVAASLGSHAFCGCSPAALKLSSGTLPHPHRSMLISEIAKKAKVSPATVSRAINQPHIVAAES